MPALTDRSPERELPDGVEGHRPVWRQPSTLMATGWLAVVLAAAALGRYLPLPDPRAITGPAQAGPSLKHLLGTDLLGQDLFSRVVTGSQVSVIAALTSVAFGLTAGGMLGIVSGYLRGPVDGVVTWLTDVLLTFPAMVLLLALVSFAGQNMTSVMTALAVLSLPVYIRIARVTTLTYRSQEFVLAAEVLGARPARIIVREILPNVASRLVPYAVLGASVAIITEGGLAFLGLSVPDSLSWGSMIAMGQDQLRDAPMAAFAPVTVMFLTIISLSVIGDRLGAAIDPRESKL